MIEATLFADFTCPYSYVMETALREIASEGRITLRPRAFELYPDATPLVPPSAEKEWSEKVLPLADALGVALGTPTFRPRTRKAHEAAYFAAQRGVGAAMRNAIFAAYWRDALDIGRIDVLQALIAPLGVDPVDLKIALDLDELRDEVAKDERVAARLNITGVPTLFLGTGPEARVLVGAWDRAALDAAIARG